jgi:serine/threonine protein kinase
MTNHFAHADAVLQIAEDFIEFSASPSLVVHTATLCRRFLMLQGSLGLAAVRAFAIWLAFEPVAAQRWRRHIARPEASCLELSATMLDTAAWRKAVLLGVAVLLLFDRPDSSLVVLRHFLSRCGAGFSTINQYLCSSSTIVGMQALLCHANDSEAEVTIAMLRHPYRTAQTRMPSPLPVVPVKSALAGPGGLLVPSCSSSSGSSSTSTSSSSSSSSSSSCCSGLQFTSADSSAVPVSNFKFKRRCILGDGATTFVAGAVLGDSGKRRDATAPDTLWCGGDEIALALPLPPNSQSDESVVLLTSLQRAKTVREQHLGYQLGRGSYGAVMLGLWNSSVAPIRSVRSLFGRTGPAQTDQRLCAVKVPCTRRVRLLPAECLPPCQSVLQVDAGRKGPIPNTKAAELAARRGCTTTRRKRVQVHHQGTMHGSSVGRGEDIEGVQRSAEALALEVKVLLELGRHPNVIHMLHSYTTPHLGSGVFAGSFLVLELADTDVHMLLKLDGARLSFMTRLSISRDLCAGYAHMHSRGWAHTDIKSDNALLFGHRPSASTTSEVTAVVSDFGCARRFGKYRALSFGSVWCSRYPEHTAAARTLHRKSAMPAVATAVELARGPVAPDELTVTPPLQLEPDVHIVDLQPSSDVYACYKHMFLHIFSASWRESASLETLRSVDAVLSECAAEDPTVRPTFEKLAANFNSLIGAATKI